MKSIYLAAIIVFLIAFSCTETKNSIPDYVIPEQELILILADIHQADAYLNFNASSKIPYEPKAFYNKILDMHHVTREKFDTSIAYYSRNPERMDSLYDKVLEHLSTLKEEFSNQKNDKK